MLGNTVYGFFYTSIPLGTCSLSLSPRFGLVENLVESKTSNHIS